MSIMRSILRGVLPKRVRRWAKEQLRRRGWHVWPRVGGVDMGDLRRRRPISGNFGAERGLPIDRWYIERFLAAHAGDVRGRVLEFGDDRYTRRFGGDRVSRGDVLSLIEGEPRATIVADITAADQIPDHSFDCIICTQTLQMIYDVPAALRSLHRILAPGGVLLATAHGISKRCRFEGVDPWGEYWHFTSQSLRRLMREAFPDADVQIAGHGNVLAAAAFLYGLASEELTQAELVHADPAYELLLTVRAVKSRRAGFSARHDHPPSPFNGGAKARPTKLNHDEPTP